MAIFFLTVSRQRDAPLPYWEFDSLWTPVNLNSMKGKYGASISDTDS